LAPESGFVDCCSYPIQAIVAVIVMPPHSQSPPPFNANEFDAFRKYFLALRKWPGLPDGMSANQKSKFGYRYFGGLWNRKFCHIFGHLVYF
jgi:hypothetical protein